MHSSPDHKAFMKLLPYLTALIAVTTPASGESILIPPPVRNDTAPTKLLLVIPGGPPAHDYQAMAQSIQKHSAMQLYVGIAVCKSHIPIYNISLCDPEFELTPVLNALITRANASASLKPSDVFVSGHGVGGMLARHYVDTEYHDAGGIVFLGTQYTGDTENFITGLLGYPTDPATYPTPFLAMTGELDKFSVDNLALTVRKWKALPATKQMQAYPVVIPGMDESSYAFPYRMSDDIVPELDQSNATQIIGEIAGLTLALTLTLTLTLTLFPAAWLDVLGGVSKSTEKFNEWAKATIAITQPFLDAVTMDQTWCKQTQLDFPGIPNTTEVVVTHVPGYKLDSCHTKHEIKPDGALKLTLCDYTSYTYHNQPPWEPQYAGAAGIACKYIGEDRIAQLLKLPLPDMKAASVLNRCKVLNAQALEAAKRVVGKHWPKALQRFAEQGKRVEFLNDTQTYAGPQWLLEGLGFKEDSKEISVQGTALITTVKSLIYPGSHYCKLMSPSKAVDILMTMGLTKRYK